MGEVWKATDTRLGRTVAIKVLNGLHSERFEQEARAIAALNHPHICTLHDVGPDYLVMEYIDGVALSGPLPVEEALRLALQMAAALEAAHAKGITHRDLKPANILVTKEGVKLLDFGLAKAVDGTDATRTIEGTILGTPAYMAPEQIEGKPCDARSDVFSFGAVLYEMLTGSRAFEGMAAVLRDDPKPPPALGGVVMRCLEKQPARRFQSMAELREALQQVTAKPAEKQPSIAVLPFANMSADKENEYFSDGLAEEILNLLAKIPGLKVIARTSSFAFRGKEQDITKIAEALGVSTILEGSVRRAGNRIRVTAQLIHAADGAHIWSERYDRELADVFAVQDEISAAIAGALQLKLSPQAAAKPRYTPKLPAYEAYLKARHYHWKFTPEAMERAKVFYEQAIALDPQFALARPFRPPRKFGYDARARDHAGRSRPGAEGAGTGPFAPGGPRCPMFSRRRLRLRLERGCAPVHPGDGQRRRLSVGPRIPSGILPSGTGPSDGGDRASRTRRSPRPARLCNPGGLSGLPRCGWPICGGGGALPSDPGFGPKLRSGIPRTR
jgi:TolB-like protein